MDFFGQSFTDMMDELFSNAVTASRDSFVPASDISETDKAFELQIHLPGMNRKDINVDVEGGQLIVSGERKLQNETEKKTLHKVETRYGAFKRVFHLPDTINEDSINAVYKDGILTVTVEKDSEKVKKQIEIK